MATDEKHEVPQAMSPEAERLLSKMAPSNGLYNSGYRAQVYGGPHDGPIPAFRVGSSIRTDAPYRVTDPTVANHIASGLSTPNPRYGTSTPGGASTAGPPTVSGREVSDVDMANFRRKTHEISRVFNSTGMPMIDMRHASDLGNTSSIYESRFPYSTPAPSRREAAHYTTAGPDTRSDLPPPGLGSIYVSSRNGPPSMYASGYGNGGPSVADMVMDDSRFAHSATGRIYTRHSTEHEMRGGPSPAVIARASYRYADEYMDAPMGASMDRWLGAYSSGSWDPRSRIKASSWSDSLVPRRPLVGEYNSPYFGNNYYPSSLAYRFEPTFQHEPPQSAYIRELLSREPPVYDGAYTGPMPGRSSYQGGQFTMGQSTFKNVYDPNNANNTQGANGLSGHTAKMAQQYGAGGGAGGPRFPPGAHTGQRVLIQ